ncbi:hypothetical protein TcasGA2_TC009002 [Tribolium castaneum]|uniref:Uncharacterized protein n=1 Tax=Tribolium castaneum TaxID=7070 RepID=D6WPY2_TRICA|nr:hypothetical protein TcasGA2_TC009002 [Tribolium castaneum]
MDTILGCCELPPLAHNSRLPAIERSTKLTPARAPRSEALCFDVLRSASLIYSVFTYAHLRKIGIFRDRGRPTLIVPISSTENLPGLCYSRGRKINFSKNLEKYFKFAHSVYYLRALTKSRVFAKTTRIFICSLIIYCAVQGRESVNVEITAVLRPS